jgi:hypothetical protein
VTRLSDWFVPQPACPAAPVPTTTPGAVAAAAASAKALDRICPSNKQGASQQQQQQQQQQQAVYAFPDVESLPLVGDVLASYRQRLNALNGPDAKPV